MASDEKLELPSYEDSVGTGSSWKDQRPDGQRILDSLTTVRAKHIRDTVIRLVYPLIEGRAKRGLSRTVLALIPSNALVVDGKGVASGFSQEESSVTAMELHGIVSDEDDISEIRLQGHLNTNEFWRQKDVVQDLEKVLQEKLSSSPVFHSKSNEEPEPLITSPPLSPPPPPERRGFFGRRSSSKQVVQPAPVVVQVVKKGVEVKVELEEVCLRTVSPFGLFETVTRAAVVVRVDARC